MSGSSRIGPGTRIDQFLVRRLLGRGGMGEVYLARDTQLGRRVALKIIRPDRLARHEGSGAEDEVARFLAEARATAAVTHPNIVTLYAAGSHEGRPYLALEYLEGQSLRDRLAEERLGAREAARWARDIAEALVAAHAQGVHHRDLKPDNVVLGVDGRLRVVDFGLARRVDGGVDADALDDQALATPETRGAVGTPAYMAPEVWRAEVGGGPADVWALGIMLHEMVFGRRPYTVHERRVVDLVGAVTSPAPTPVESAEGSLHELPPGLVQLIAGCLDKAPERRPTPQALVDALSAILHGRQELRESEAGPFRGLLAFSERHAGVFFGRDLETAAFVERLRTEPVLPVVGPSGAGKSSFVQAGVIPRLREQGAWIVLHMRPGREPFMALAARLAAGETESSAASQRPPSETQPASLTETGEGLEGGRPAFAPVTPSRPKTQSSSAERLRALRVELAEELRLDPRRLNIRLNQLAERERCRVLLFVDQLEELYTIGREEDRATFMRAVCLAAEDATDPVRVVLSLRDDFLGRIAEGPEVRRTLGRLTVMRSPGPEALEETLRAPLRTVGYRFDDEALPGAMVADVGDQAACLPLLQFAARALWDRRDREARTLRAADYESMGGVAGALAEHADGVLEGLDPTEVALARSVLLRLVTPEGTRRVVPLEEATSGLEERAGAVVERLVEARLLVVRKATTSEGSGAELELAHEALIESWGKLARWLESSRDERTALAELSQAATLWSQRGSRQEELWTGAALAEGQRSAERIRRMGEAVPELVETFLERGERLTLRRARRKRVLWASGAVALLGVAVVSLIVAVTLSEKEAIARDSLELATAQQAEAQREGARAAFLNKNMVGARAKLRTSLEQQDSPLARALWWTLDRSPIYWQRQMGVQVYSSEFSPDGQTLAVATQGSTIHLLDRETVAERVLRGHKDQVLNVAWSPEGRRLASTDWAGAVLLWDVDSGAYRELVGGEHYVVRVRFSPDGRLLAGSSRGHLLVWTLERPEAPPTRYPTGDPQWLNSVDFSPDGRELAAAGRDNKTTFWTVGEVQPRLRVSEPGVEANAVEYSPDGRLLAVVAATTVLLDARTGELRARLSKGKESGAFLSGGELALGGRAGGVEVWGAGGARLDKVFDARGATGLAAHGGLLATAGGGSGWVQLWRLERASEPRVEPHTGMVAGVSAAPGGRVASGGAHGRVILWDAASGKPERELAHDGPVWAVTLATDGRRLAIGSGKAIHLYDLEAEGAPAQVLRGHSGDVASVAFHPDGERLVSACWGRDLLIWAPAKSSEPVARIATGMTRGFYDMALSPDGERVAVGGNNRVVGVFELSGAHPVDGAPAAGGANGLRLEGHTGPIRGVAFRSPRELASASEDGTVVLWDLERDTRRVLAEGLERAYWLSWDPTGQRLGVPSADGTARIIDAEGGGQVRLVGHKQEVAYVRWLDRERVVTSSDDGTVRLWSARDGRPLWWAAAPPGRLAGPSPSDEVRRMMELPEVGRRCLVTHAGEATLVPASSGGGGDPLARTAVSLPVKLAPFAEGCALLSGGTVVALTPKGAREIASGVSAMAAHDGAGGDRGLLVADQRAIRVLDGAGRTVKTLPGAADLSAVLRLADATVLGYANGGMELVPDAEGEPGFLFEETPSSRVELMREGPSGTAIVGFGNGTLGLWSTGDGVRLHAEQLHGPVVHMVREGTRLLAGTELGDRTVLDLGVLEAPYCELMDAVWASVPVVWESGRAVREPAPSDHPCRRAE